MIEIYTDGACSVSSGKGGWGVYIIMSDGKEIKLSGNSENTTNNQMEMTAVIEGLRYFKTKKEIN